MRIVRILGLLLCLIMLFAIHSSAVTSVSEVSAKTYKSYKDIPEVTDAEISAIEELQRQGTVFRYGTILSTETFENSEGSYSGFTALMCDWLSELFEIPFEISIYEWDEMLLGLESGEIDFVGELTATDARKEIYFMTDAIAERNVKYLRIDGSERLSDIELERRLRFAFLEGVTTVDDVLRELGDVFDITFVGDYETAYELLSNGTIDAFIEEGTAEAVFDAYSDVHSEDLLPQIFSPVSLTTQKERNAAVISIVQKALKHGSAEYLTELYNKGAKDYVRHKLYLRLTAEELSYLSNTDVIKFVAASDNYPLSFYNEYDKEFQGVSWDVLKEVADLTGLEFEFINDEHTSRTQIGELLKSGDADMMASLVHTDMITSNFLWTSNTIMSDYHALISKSDLKHVTMNEILNLRVGVVVGYTYTEVFQHWFPRHKGISEYSDFPQAFDALERNEIDLLMGSQSLLLMQANYREKPGYKINILFKQSFGYTFGFNETQTELCGIIDKSLQMIDITTISSDWFGRTYDYMDAITRVQSLAWMGIILLCLCILIILYIFYHKNAKTARRLRDFHKVIIEEAAELVEYRDSDTGGHIGRTSLYLRYLLDALLNSPLYKEQASCWNVEQLVLSAQLHDVGKVAIGDAILCKPGKLTSEEYDEMKKHTLVGGEIITKLQNKAAGMDFLNDAKTFAVYHHERWDGKGYPYGISGDSIPLLARLMALIDVYDALVSERPYKKPFTHTEAKQIIQEGRGTQFDPELTDLFICAVVDKLKYTE